MRRGLIFIILALVLIAGIALVFLATQGIISLPGLTPQVTPTSLSSTGTQVVPTSAPTKKVLIVVQPIARGKVFTQADISNPEEGIEGSLEFRDFEVDMVMPGWITDTAKVIGKVAKQDLNPYEPLTTSRLIDEKGVSTGGCADAALLVDRGMVAVSIPISRLSAVSYAPRAGDHVNVIVTMLLLDLDTNFQSALPNTTGAVVAPGPAVLLGLGSGNKAANEATASEKATNISAQLNTSEQIKTINAQVVGGGAASAYGRAEQDPNLEQTFYLMPSEGQRPRMVSQTLLLDVKILQVGTCSWTEQVRTPTPTPNPDAEPTPEAAQIQKTAEPTIPPPDIITLIVRPQDAVTLNYLLYSGAELTLALRNVDDTDRIATEAVTLQYLLDAYSIRVPVKLPYGMEPRTDELIAPDLPNDKPTPVPVK